MALTVKFPLAFALLVITLSVGLAPMKVGTAGPSKAFSSDPGTDDSQKEFSVAVASLLFLWRNLLGNVLSRHCPRHSVRLILFQNLQGELRAPHQGGVLHLSGASPPVSNLHRFLSNIPARRVLRSPLYEELYACSFSRNFQV